MGSKECKLDKLLKECIFLFRDHSMNASDELDSGKEPLLNNGSGIGTQQNGKATKNGQNGVKKANNNKTSLVDVKTTSVQQKSEKVTLMGGDEPKKKQGCCSLMWN